MKKYLFSYSYDDHDYSQTVPDDNPLRAQARVKAMASARYDGELFATTPAVSGAWLPRLICWIKNRG
jgi:hypothetical protein